MATEDSTTIESPPSSPDHTHLSRLKASEWIKSVDQVDQSCHNETMKTPVDSGKKGRAKRFVTGGLADRLHVLVQRQSSELTFWEHSLLKQQQHVATGKLPLMYTVEIFNAW